MSRRAPSGLPLAKAAGLLLATAAASCGWHAGISPPTALVPAPAPGTSADMLSPDPTDASGSRRVSVGVDVFDVHRDVLERNLEPALHREVSRAVTELVDAPLASPREATLVIRGEILEYRRRAGIRSRDNELLETGLRITIRAELVRRATGEAIRPPIVRRNWSGYTLGESGNEEEARDRNLRNLAQTLVLDLFRPHPDGEGGGGNGEDGGTGVTGSSSDS